MISAKMFKFGMFAMVFLVVFQVGFTYIPKESDAILQTVATISLDQSSQTAQVAPGQQGIVTFTGTVTVDMTIDSTVQKVLVSLTGSSGGWATTVTPSTLAFSRQVTSQTFSVSVKVPPGTSYSVTQELIVGGTCRNVPGLAYNVDETKAMINVKQFYKFSVECSKPFLEVAPGDQFVFQLKIRNMGNYQDTLRISQDPITEKKLVDMGWAVMLSQTDIILDEGMDQVVKISVTPPKEWNVWKNEITTIKVKIYSFQALGLGEIPVETTYPMYVRERGASAPGFEFELMAFALVFVAMMIVGVAGRNLSRLRYRRRA